MVKCVCGFENPDESKFCGACGAKIESKSFCANCGAELIAGAKFCPMCGTAAGVAGQNCTQSVNGFENMHETRQSGENTEVKFDRLEAVLEEEKEEAKRRSIENNKNLIEAVKAQNTDKVKRLLKAGADPNTKDIDGKTPLEIILDSDWAFMQDENCYNAIELINNGGSPNVSSSNGYPAIFVAVEALQWGDPWDEDSDEKYFKLITVLLNHGANVNAKNCNGKTALDWCAANLFNGENEDKCIELLLKAGAKTTSNKSLIDLYKEKMENGKIKRKYEEIISVLRSYQC